MYNTLQNIPKELYDNESKPSDTWDYKNPLPPKLSLDFYQSYIVTIKGKQYVKVEGLVVLLHAKGFKSLTTELIVKPEQSNGNTAIFKTTIVGYGWDPIKGEIQEVTVTGSADANPGNVGPVVAAHFIRIAETRSIGRALRNYTNVNICTLEEIGSVIQLPLIRSDQINQIASIMKKHSIPQEEGRNVMIKTIGKYDLKTTTEDEADTIIKALNKHILNNQNKSVTSSQVQSIPKGIVPPTAHPLRDTEQQGQQNSINLNNIVD